MSIPADFRAVLEARDPAWQNGANARLVLQYSDNLKDHLRVYTVDEIETIRARILRAPEGHNKRGLARIYFTQTTTIDVDKDGRIVLPIRHREKLGLTEGGLTFLGYGAYFEIWKSETFGETKAQEFSEWLDAIPEGVDPLSLIDDLPEV